MDPAQSYSFQDAPATQHHAGRPHPPSQNSQRILQSSYTGYAPAQTYNYPDIPIPHQDNGAQLEAAEEGSDNGPNSTSNDVVTGKTKKDYPLVDEPGRYQMKNRPNWQEMTPEQQASVTVVDRKMKFVTSTTEERKAVRFAPPIAKGTGYKIGKGLKSGKGYLGYLDPSRPDTAVTNRPLKIDGKKLSKPFAKYPAPEQIIPAGLSLGDICSMYPNHVWGQTLRIFAAEDLNGTQVHAMLPHDFLVNQKKALQGRKANYMEHAIGRQADAAMVEDGFARRMYMNKSKGRKRKQNIDNEEDDDDEDATMDDEDAVDADGQAVGNTRNQAQPSKRQKTSKSSSKPGDRNKIIRPSRLSVLGSHAVRSLVRQSPFSRIPPESVLEMQWQQQLENQSQIVKMLLSDRIMARDQKMVTSSFSQRMSQAEQVYREEFNHFVATGPLLDSSADVLPPILDEHGDAFEVLLTIKEHEKIRSGQSAEQLSAPILRRKAYKELNAFLTQLKSEVIDELDRKTPSLPHEVVKKMASLAHHQTQALLARGTSTLNKGAGRATMPIGAVGMQGTGSESSPSAGDKSSDIWVAASSSLSGPNSVQAKAGSNASTTSNASSNSGDPSRNFLQSRTGSQATHPQQMQSSPPVQYHAPSGERSGVFRGQTGPSPHLGGAPITRPTPASGYVTSYQAPPSTSLHGLSYDDRRQPVPIDPYLETYENNYTTPQSLVSDNEFVPMREVTDPNVGHYSDGPSFSSITDEGSAPYAMPNASGGQVDTVLLEQTQAEFDDLIDQSTDDMSPAQLLAHTDKVLKNVFGPELCKGAEIAHKCVVILNTPIP